MTFGFCNAEVTGELETTPPLHRGRELKEERMGVGKKR